MRIIFTCGGTAGHIYPAVAVADLIKRTRPDSKIIFVGATGRMETELVPREGYEIRTVEISNFSRGLSPAGIKHNLGTLRKLRTSRDEAKKILDDFKPDVVVGTGGYASYPIIRAAAARGIPTAIHESNAVPGLTTKVLARQVDRIMVAYEDSRSAYVEPEKVAVTGTPVRAGFTCHNREAVRAEMGIRPDGLLLVTFWGSLGARDMNVQMAEFCAFSGAAEAFRHIHATGKGKLAAFKDAVRAHGVDPDACPQLDLREYIFDMPRVMAAADLVICRAGASTLAEIVACGVPAILVPSPNVTGNHQEKNARLLEKSGAAKVIIESECSGASLFETANELLLDARARRRMRQAQQKLAAPDSAARILGIIDSITLQNHSA